MSEPISAQVAVNGKGNRWPPGPTGLPMFGIALKFLRDPLEHA